MPFHLKRIYEVLSPLDGKRILVDRLWPRGISKEKARVEVWMRDIAPSPDLRIWFGHRSERFEEFKQLYRSELIEDRVRAALLEQLLQWAAAEPVTLLYAAKDPVYNHPSVLLEVLQERS